MTICRFTILLKDHLPSDFSPIGISSFTLSHWKLCNGTFAVQNQVVRLLVIQHSDPRQFFIGNFYSPIRHWSLDFVASDIFPHGSVHQTNCCWTFCRQTYGQSTLEQQQGIEFIPTPTFWGSQTLCHSTVSRQNQSHRTQFIPVRSALNLVVNPAARPG